MTNYIINVKHLSKQFAGKMAVRDVSLQVAQGEIFGFLGPNGSGKTTTIRMLCGLLTPDSGTGTCLGFNVLTEAERIKMQVGYMTQRFSLYEDLSVYENLDFMARMYEVKNRKQRVATAIESLGLMDRSSQLAGTLSGGWKQRVALSAALLHSPKLLLLDEPTAGVDPKARRDFWDQVHRLAAQGVTTLVSTHYMDEAERCTRLAYINKGDILTQGTAQAIIEESGLYTWQLHGDAVWSLSNELNNMPGVEQVVVFGNVLHVSGRNADLLQHTLNRMAHRLQRLHKIQPSLEDVFISLYE